MGLSGPCSITKCASNIDPTLRYVLGHVTVAVMCNRTWRSVGSCGALSDPLPSLHFLSLPTAMQATVPPLCTCSMILFGDTFLPLLKWDQHMETVISKANSRRYFLVVLKQAAIHAG